MLLSSDEQDFHSMLSVDNTSEEIVGIVFFFCCRFFNRWEVVFCSLVGSTESKAASAVVSFEETNRRGVPIY